MSNIKKKFFKLIVLIVVSNNVAIKFDVFDKIIIKQLVIIR